MGIAGIDLLLDGEPADGRERENFTLDACPVDLIATLAEDG